MATINPQTIDGFSIPLLNFLVSFSAGVHQRNYDYLYTGSNYCYTISDNRLIGIIAAANPGTTYNTKRYNDNYYPDPASDEDTEIITTYTYNNKTVYWGTIGVSPVGNYRENAMPLLEPLNTEQANLFIAPGAAANYPMIAWAMIYGDVTPDGFNVTYDLDNCTGDIDNPIVIPPSAVVTNTLFIPDTGAAFNSGSVWIDGDGIYPGVSVNFVWEPETGSLKIGQVSSNITVHVYAVVDPYSGSGGTSPIPGGGSVSIPGMPGLTATSSGVIGLFAPSVSQMRSLADFMWTDFGGTGTSTEDILKEIVQAIKRTISNPLDYIIGFNIIPSQGLSIGSSSTIRFGYINSNVSMPRLSNQYFTVDCGSIHFNTVCDDTFLDYAPYAKFSIYLPYIGVKEVDANDFVGHTIGVMYRGDVVTGGVTAYILKDGSVMYQYSGCCALNIPLTADNWGAIISGVINIATSVVGGFATGGAAGAASGALKGAANVAANPASLSPQVMRSGAVSGSAGCMGVQYPFVIREAVSYHDTAGFNTVEGYPSFYFKSLGSIYGYTVVSKVNLVNIPATRDELTEIETLLKEGVIF